MPGVQVDVDQDVMTHVLLNEHRDGSGKFPHEFHGKEYMVKDAKTMYWTLPLKVEECKKKDFIKDMQSGSQKYTYVLVYPIDFENPKGSTHCVYVEKFVNGEAHCLNSNLKDPFPKISLFQDDIFFYRVSCAAKMYQPDNKSSVVPGARQQSNEDQVDWGKVSPGAELEVCTRLLPTEKFKSPIIIIIFSCYLLIHVSLL